ncbi:hypothetical protein G6549_26525 [Bacillus sp. MM2020_1]|nr:hypothetical protein [Bacillus sp. MM2020_1]
MKVNNLNVAEQRATYYTIPPEENLLPIFLGNEDVHALGRLRSRWNLVTHEETIQRAIEERHSLKELTVSKTGRHVNQGTIWLEKDLRKKIIKEATKLEMDTGNYIRGIIYSLNEKLGQEEIAERERQNKIRHDNRKISLPLTLNKDLREKLFKRFEKELQKDELREKVKKRPAPMNGTTLEDRMLQEVLNNYLMEYLNK